MAALCINKSQGAISGRKLTVQGAINEDGTTTVVVIGG